MKSGAYQTLYLQAFGTVPAAKSKVKTKDVTGGPATSFSSLRLVIITLWELHESRVFDHYIFLRGLTEAFILA